MNNDMSKQADVLYEHVMNQQLWTQAIESMVTLLPLTPSYSLTHSYSLTNLLIYSLIGITRDRYYYG